MPNTTAHVKSGIHRIRTAGQNFDFGEDGSRQVTEAEQEALQRWSLNSGNEITFKDAPAKADKGGKS